MKLKALAIAGLALLGVVSLPQDTWAGGSCPTGSQRDEYTSSLAECSLPKEDEIKETNGGKDLMDIVTQIINVVVGIVGVVAVAAIVAGGIFYVTSTGDSAKTKRAMNTIIYGVVGLIVATIAFAIVNFVLKAVFSSSDSSGGADKDGDKGGKTKEENASLIIDYLDDIA